MPHMSPHKGGGGGGRRGGGGAASLVPCTVKKVSA
jgi:hypothetical protein